MIGSHNRPTPYLALAATCKVYYEMLRKKSSSVEVGFIIAAISHFT